MRRAICLFLLSFVLIGASRCSVQKVGLDAGIPALEGRDKTALVDGCGTQLQTGMTLCRKMTGDVGDDELYLVGPAADCLSDDYCVRWKIYFPSGAPALSGAIPKGETRQAVRWQDLVKRSEYELSDGGFWGLRYWVRYVGLDGNEREAISDGEIHLIVHTKEYEPLHESREDPNFVWEWEENGVEVKMTTGARTYVEKR